MTTVVRVLAQALTVLLLTASLASAQATPSNKARARELYAQGQQLFRQGEFVTAQRAFEDAYRAIPNPVVLLSIAECQVRNEDFAGAIASLRQYLNEKPGAPDRTQVESQIANLETKPGYINIDSAPPGAMIWVDGENTGYLTPNELSLRAGRHMIQLRQPGYVPADQPVDVAIGSRQRFTVNLQAEAPAAVAENAPTEDGAPAVSTDRVPRRRRHGSPAIWAATAVAGVTLITGTALGVTALLKQKDYDDAPTAAKRTRGQRIALFADVNFGIAAAAGVTALVLYLTSGGEPEQTKSVAWTIAPELSRRELGVAGQLRF
jgi:tetratricopeptide (TPR) repeat protein